MLCRAKDLNADGLFIVTAENADLNYMVDLAVTLPTGKISFTGVVRFIGQTRYGQGIGVQLHVISKEDQLLWLAFYRAQLNDMIETLPRNIARHLVAHR